MKIQRYGLGREYAGNTGSPAITEQADGAYVRYEDFQRMEAAHKAHNEMLVLRTKKAEGAQPSVPNGYVTVPQSYIDVVNRAAEIASSYSPCIDAVEEAGGENAEDPTWAIHHRLYYASFLLKQTAPTPPANGQEK